MLTLQQLAVFLLILARIAGIFIQAPILSSRSFPAMAKSALAVWIAIVLWFVTPYYSAISFSMTYFVLALVSEVAVGFIIGFICNIIFIAVQSAGEIIDLQMGLSVATALDPVFGAVVSIIGRLSFYLALVIFLCVDGHHLIFSALHQSFTALPAGKICNFINPDILSQIMSLNMNFWNTAVKLAAPTVLIIFIADFAFGIVSRVAPQVNVFMLGFQVKPLLGLIGIMMGLPIASTYIANLTQYMTQQLALFLQIIK